MNDNFPTRKKGENLEKDFEPWVKEIFISLQATKFYGRIEVIWNEGRIVRVVEMRQHVPQYQVSMTPRGQAPRRKC